MHSRRTPQWRLVAVFAGLMLAAWSVRISQAQPPLPQSLLPAPGGSSTAGTPAAGPGSAAPPPLAATGSRASERPAQGPAPSAYDGDAAAQSEPIVRVHGRRMRVQIVERFARIFQLGGKILRVDGFDPEILGITTIERRPDQVRAHAVRPGVTTVILVDEYGSSHEVEVFVTGDVRHLQAYIDRFFPRASVRAVAVRDSVVLRGYVTQPEHITELVEIAEQFYPRVLNQMKVGGVQQVKLKVRVMEVQRSKIRQLGFNFLYTNRNSWLGSTPGQLAPVSSLTAALPDAGGSGAITPPVLGVLGAALGDPTATFGVITPDNMFQGFLEALKTEGLLKILAEPELTTTNGRPATLLNGGEFPILVPQSLGTVSIEWREFGVRLEAVPIILGGGRLRLEVQPEVSERDFANAVDIDGTRVPGLTTRRVNTQVEMKFGQTLMIAGLISRRETADAKKIPVLGELPLVGAAFRRVQYDEVETELVVMVTPELVAPLNNGQVPEGGPGRFSTTPTDRELYRDGFLEVPRYGDECEDCGPAGGSAGRGMPTPVPAYPVSPQSGLIGPGGRMLPAPRAGEYPGGQPVPARDQIPGPPPAPVGPGGPRDAQAPGAAGGPPASGTKASGSKREQDPFQTGNTPSTQPIAGQRWPKSRSRFMQPGRDRFGGPSPFGQSPFRLIRNERQETAPPRTVTGTAQGLAPAGQQVRSSGGPVEEDPQLIEPAPGLIGPAPSGNTRSASSTGQTGFR